MLIKVKIKNFYSIKQEQIIKINNTITTLIGKNESGKSTILKAIEKLNGHIIEEKEKNVNLKNEPSYIIGIYKLTKEEITNINLNIKAKDSIERLLILPEQYDNLYYSIESNDKIGITNYRLLKMEADNNLIDITDKNINNINNLIKSYIKDECITTELTDFVDKLLKLSKEEINDFLSEPSKFTDITLTETLINYLNFYNNYNRDYWKDLLPKYKYVLFSSFKDVLQDNITINEVKNSKQAKNVLALANIDIKELEKAFELSDEQKLEDIQSQYIDIVTEKFKRIFNQADRDFKLKIRLGSRNNSIMFLTIDNTSESKTISLSQRSDGFRWYLSLYLSLYEYINNLKNECKYILLLDEPNLYLHPAAQNDLLHEVFLKDFKDLQIIYSTHSPYMINAENSFSIRIIEKDTQTKVYNSSREYALNKGTKDVDTITPILYSIGINVSNNVVINNEEKVIITEGIQDIYILKAFIKILNYEERFKNIIFISGMSAEKVPYMFSYLYGLGYNTFAIFDFDKAGRKAIKEIISEDDTSELKDRLLTYNINDEKNDCLLENIFSEKDLNEYMPKKSTITCKEIYDKYNKMNFEKKTKDNFKKLFDIILRIINK